MFTIIAERIAIGIEGVGIAIIVCGAAISTWRFLHDWVSTRGFDAPYQGYRSNLGRAILLGLEFLVAADIVGTVVVDPTFENLGVLALIVAIRTALSFALEVEINGHWPWQQAALRRGQR
ncbi:MAG: DUF1622 domain-containing protein [Deltaproteobacteria bacterium]|nr:MAG: DUF1622 domain-containing protein [Deltaproteobacteria bacterium]